jgi:hypothetical protein
MQFILRDGSFKYEPAPENSIAAVRVCFVVAEFGIRAVYAGLIVFSLIIVVYCQIGMESTNTLHVQIIKFQMFHQREIQIQVLWYENPCLLLPVAELSDRNSLLTFPGLSKSKLSIKAVSYFLCWQVRASSYNSNKLTNQMQQFYKFITWRFVSLNMFQAPPRPSSGAYNCINPYPANMENRVSS